MPNDDFGRELSELARDYHIQTELPGRAGSRTYLARHLGLNRDVTVTLIPVPSGGRGHDPLYLVSDSRLLATLRYNGVVPVIEGRWLGVDTYAIVRARVRGSTLDQLLATVGPLSPPVAASALQQINAALEWARSNGVVHRHVPPDCVVFQQGSGRVLIALDPLAASSGPLPPNACDDARTIGDLAATMLTGRREDAPSGVTLARIRPDLPRRIVEETEALRRCDRSGRPPDVGAYLARLGGGVGVGVVAGGGGGAVSNAEVQRVPAARVAGTAAMPAAAGPILSTRKVAEPVEAANSGVGFAGRMMTALLVASAMIVMGVLLLRERSGASLPWIGQSAADSTTVSASDTTSQSTENVARRARQADSALFNAARPPVITQPPPTQPTSPTPTSPIEPPTTKRHEPETPITPSVTMPMPGAAGTDTNRRPVDGVAGAVAPVPEVCTSPAASDQRTCLSTVVEQGDRDLNAVYQQLIGAMRRQAAVAVDAPDPPAVEQLRAANRKWLEKRDDVCHAVGEGPLYARARGACYAGQAAQRMRELQQQLASIPGDAGNPRD